MAKNVAPGHFKINDENLDASRIAGRKIKSNAFDDNSKKKSPQPEASSKKDFLNFINIEEEGKKSPQTKASSKEIFLKFINIDEDIPWHDHCKCIEEEEAAKMKRVRSALKRKYPEEDEDEDDCISIQEEKKVPGSPQYSFQDLLLPPLPDGFSGLLDYSMESPPHTPPFTP